MQDQKNRCSKVTIKWETQQWSHHNIKLNALLKNVMRIWITAEACITSILSSFIAGKFNGG